MAFKIATIGCGGMARQGHGPAHARYAREQPEVELVACCDVRAAAAESFRAEFGYRRAYSDFEELLAAERPDAVCVYVPVMLTTPVVCRVFALGYPVLTEKPPGMTTAEIDQLIAAAGSVPHQVAFNRRFTPLIRELRRQLPGHLHHLEYDFTRVDRRDADFSTTAIHGLDTVRFLAGADYRHLRIRYQHLPELGPAVANTMVDGELTSGVTVHLAFCPVAGVVVERATVQAHDHTWYLQVPVWGAFDSPGRLQHFERGQLVTELDGGSVGDGREMFEESGFYAENAAFFDDLRAGRRPACDLPAARQSVQVMEALRERRAEFVADEA
ncbi:MAG: Gfo/Idh/MocA family oxidoreductase [Armatimonadetes bacterium]|nr:Gfo/Idh/MocA family oxidoreductase [Armatimonadota bacterium]